MISSNKELIRNLLHQSHSINLVNRQGLAPLHLAAREGLLDMVLFLVLDVAAVGKDPLNINIVDKVGW